MNRITECIRLWWIRHISAPCPFSDRTRFDEMDRRSSVPYMETGLDATAQGDMAQPEPDNH